jgi:S1-C subfamily serine protease
VWRDGEAIELALGTIALDGEGIDRAVSWAGALLQDPHRAMAAQRGIDRSGVYVAFFSYGSPATRYGLWAGRRIVSVDDIDTPDLQAFVDVIRGKDNAVQVITLKLDNQYWPAYEIRRTDDGWRRNTIS